MTADGYLLFLTRYANLKKVHSIAQDAGMKDMWQRKLNELVNGIKEKKYEN